MKITSDENVNQAVEQMVQAIRNTDAYLEYQKQLARVKEQSELKRQIDEFRTRNFELQTSKDTNFDKLDQFTRENEAFRENPLVSDFLAAELAFCRMMQGISVASPSSRVIRSSLPALRKFSFAIGILFSYFSIVVI